MIWFTADTHFGHARIIEYCNRPFRTVEEMDETLLKYWKSLNKGDVLYHLGDIALKKSTALQVLDFIPEGVEVHLILGNHDSHNLVHHNLTSVSDRKIVKHNNLHIVLEHYPMRSWPHAAYGAIQLHGHCHGKMEPLPRQLDVSVDSARYYLGEYRPFSWDEMLQYVVSTNILKAGNMRLTCSVCKSNTPAKKPQKRL